MTKDKYARYGLVLIAGGAVALWAGVSPSLLIFLLVCPLMMFFMMRGMHGGQEGHDGHSNHNDTESRSADVQQAHGDDRRG